MITVVDNISSLNPSKIQSNDPNFPLKQFTRSYPGDFSLNFVKCLSSINSIQTKNYTNFYLTNEYKYSEITEDTGSTLIFPYIHGPIKYGDLFLKFTDIDPRPYARANRSVESENYGVGVFTTEYDETCDFTLKTYSKNRCNLYHTKDHKEYFLCCDADNQLIFVKKHLLNFDESTIGVQDFDYVYSEDLNYIFLYKRTPNGDYSVINYNNTLQLNSLIEGDLISNTKTPFKLSKGIYDTTQKIPDNSFITYLGDNTIDITKSEMSLSNNLLLHKKFMDEDSNIDIIVLKNNLTEDNIFSSANNLLSGGNTAIYVDGLREYTNILNDIDSETSDNLELNYVFYNTSFPIKGGDNFFISPSSMYPFSQLNVNDSKFVSNGAFGYISPEYADKIYHLSNDKTLRDNGQHLLCTWLSGSHSSENKIWVDRYYYPDLIDKRSALSGISELSTTYDSYIESLIYNNSNIYDSVKYKKFFDKKSDLIFTPNQKYLYVRMDYTNSSLLSSFLQDSVINKVNYFNDINKSGEFTLGFSFMCDDVDWVLSSSRNEINSGLSFIKSGYDLSIIYDIYDSTDSNYDTTEYSWIRHSKIVKLDPMKVNYISVGVDSKTKTSYFFVNNVMIYEFKLPTYQLYIKQLLYGDFYININGERKKFTTSVDRFDNIFILNRRLSPANLNLMTLLLNVDKIDDIQISLPCGMMNGLDSIDLLNSICGASTFKSNFIDINIKNLNISNKEILSKLSDSIKNNLQQILPVNSTVKNINFNNYK